MVGGLTPIGVVFGVLGVGGLALAARQLVTLAGRLLAALGAGSRRMVTGRVRGEPVERGPVSGTPCVGYLLAREAYVTLEAGVPFVRVWRSKGVETTLAGFELETDEGTVGVRPTRGDRFRRLASDAPEGVFGDHRLTRDAVSEAFEPGERPTTAIGEAFDRPVPTDSRHRYVEYRIEAGDQCSVVGTPDGDGVTEGLTIVDGGRWRLLIGPTIATIAYGLFGALALVVPLAQLFV